MFCSKTKTWTSLMLQDVTYFWTVSTYGCSITRIPVVSKSRPTNRLDVISRFKPVERGET